MQCGVLLIIEKKLNFIHLPRRSAAAVSSVTADILQRTSTEVDYRQDIVCRPNNGTDIKTFWGTKIILFNCLKKHQNIFLKSSRYFNYIFWSGVSSRSTSMIFGIDLTCCTSRWVTPQPVAPDCDPPSP